MKRGQSLITASAATLAEGGCHSCIHSDASAAGTHGVRKNKCSHSSELGDSLHSDRYTLLTKPLRAALVISFLLPQNGSPSEREKAKTWSSNWKRRKVLLLC